VPISANTINIVRRGMEKVIVDGTGKDLDRIDGVQYAGKSGTAEYCDNVAQKKDLCKFGAWPEHAWFLAYAPADKPEIAVAHAMAAEIFGMKLIYLEAGSGATRAVPDEMVRAVSSGVEIPVIVGGGIRSPETAAAKVEAGAAFIVVGNHLEDGGNYRDLATFVRATHGR